LKLLTRKRQNMFSTLQVYHKLWPTAWGRSSSELVLRPDFENLTLCCHGTCTISMRTAHPQRIMGDKWSRASPAKVPSHIQARAEALPNLQQNSLTITLVCTAWGMVSCLSL
jgi:hypothetical protein